MLILLYLYISTRPSSVHMWSMLYGSSVWSPFKLCDIKLIEGVQRRATRLSRDIRNEPYNIRLTTLGLPTLQFRRYRADMLQVFKILNGYEDILSLQCETLSNDLDLSKHIATMTNNAYSKLWFLRRNLKGCPDKLFFDSLFYGVWRHCLGPIPEIQQ